MALTDEQKSANTIAAAWGIIDSERAANARLLEQIAQLEIIVRRHEVALLKAVEPLARIAQLEQAVRYESDLCQQALDSRAQLERQLAEARKDVERLDYLENNIHNREPDDWDSRFGVCKNGDTWCWVLFAPKGVQGSARAIIDAAVARTQEPPK